MQATRIIAIRHGETAWNVDTRIQGQLDIPLNERGRWQAQRVARALAAREPMAALYSSDLLRAWDTARSIADSTGLAVITEPGLRERNFGSFQGHMFTELEAEFPAETLRWRQRDPGWAPPGGESLLQVRDRVLQVTATLAEKHLGEQIVIVTHGGVIDALYRAATSQEIDAPRTWTLGNASVNRLLWTPEGLTLTGWADSSHLDDEWQDDVIA